MIISSCFLSESDSDSDYVESTSKCKFVAKLGKMFEKDLVWGKEI